MDKTYLYIPRLRVINANAASTPYTVGFPAMTAWLGMTHALQRKIQQHDGFSSIMLPRMTVSCYNCDLQMEKPNGGGKKLAGQAHPPRLKGKKGDIAPASLIEEARCHLRVSLLIEVENLPEKERGSFLKVVRLAFPHIRVAGGTPILDDKIMSKWNVVTVDTDDTAQVRRIRNKLIPGYVPIDRSSLFMLGDGDTLDTILDVVQGKYSDEGWLCPLAVGFKDITGKKEVDGQRSYEHEHHFVEPIVTIGQFVMPFRCNNIDEMMWEYDYDEKNGVYICRNNYYN